MKKYILFWVLLFVSLSASAQSVRLVYVYSIPDRWIAAATIGTDVAINPTQPAKPVSDAVISTTSREIPYFRVAIAYVPCSCTVAPHYSGTPYWKEFKSWDGATALSYLAYYRAHFSNTGIVTTSENTFIVWWF